MGMYFVSMVLLMRMNMPVQYRSIITEVLGKFYLNERFVYNFTSYLFTFSGDLQFNFYHRWFDVMFLVAALVTLATLRLVHKRDIEAADSVKQPAYID